jgi:hypothetical protein
VDYLLSWLQTTKLLISASSVVRIIGVSHWCPAIFLIHENEKLYIFMGYHAMF